MNIAQQWIEIAKFTKKVPVAVEELPRILSIKFKEVHLPESISGMIEKDGNSYLISVNANDPRQRQRFTLAHEIGHYMLHRHLIGDGLDDDRAYRSTDKGKYRNTKIGPKEETEANKFAVGLLMPDALIKQHRDKNADNIEDMAKLFKVSKQTMAIRLGKA